VVVTVGATATDPEVALPVEKFVPVHEAAFFEPQVRVEDWPVRIAVGLAERLAVGAMPPPVSSTAVTTIEYSCAAPPESDASIRSNQYGVPGVNPEMI